MMVGDPEDRFSHNEAQIISDFPRPGLSFGFKSGICLLIAPVPVHCFSITFSLVGTDKQDSSWHGS